MLDVVAVGRWMTQIQAGNAFAVDAESGDAFEYRLYDEEIEDRITLKAWHKGRQPRAIA